MVTFKQKIASTVNGTIANDEDLLEEVANLVESPTVLLGKIDPKFLSLPKAVLVTGLNFVYTHV